MKKHTPWYLQAGLTLLVLGLTSLNLTACGAQPPVATSSVRIDSVWGEQLDHVILYFIRKGDASTTSCNALEMSPEVASYYQSCPGADPCTVLVKTINADPGTEGAALNLEAGEMSVLGLGYYSGDSSPSHDCVPLTVTAGESSEISLSL